MSILLDKIGQAGSGVQPVIINRSWDLHELLENLQPIFNDQSVLLRKEIPCLKARAFLCFKSHVVLVRTDFISVLTYYFCSVGRR
jgi:hypothetical protein